MMCKEKKTGKSTQGFRYWAIRNLCWPSVHWKSISGNHFLAWWLQNWEEPILLTRFTLPVSWDFRSLTGIRRDVPYRNCSTAPFM